MLALLLAATLTQPLQLTHIATPIVVDGNMSDEAWQSVPPLPLTMYLPTYHGTPTQRSEIRVAYDDEAFYAGAWCFETKPSGIRINSLYRDRWNGDDALAIYIDAFNDNNNAKWFGVTPAGMRFDSLVSDDGVTLNDNWDGFWNAKATITNEGWFVEVRIPFSTIGFQADDAGRAVMGLTVTRYVSRLNERVTFPDIDPKFQFRAPSKAQDVMLTGVRSGTPLYVTPYALAESARVRTAPAEHSQEAGLDVRYPITPKLTLDLTANTDFAQVEADDQQVALDRFPLFFPERRRFFQENAGVFDFLSANGLRLFHSRRIGLDSFGQPERILGGARMVGRVGKWETGLLDMQTEHENFGVFRFRRGIRDPQSTAGLMLTTYVGDGRSNFALGGDTTLHLKGDHYLLAKFASVRDSERDGDFLSSSLFDVRWERRTQRGLSANAQLSRAGRDFRPELGFVPRTDFTSFNTAGNYYIFTDKHRYFRRIYPGAVANSLFRNSDHKLESGVYAVWVQWDTKSGGGGWVEPKWFHENVLVPFTVGGKIHIPAGVYNFADLQLVYFVSTGRKLRTDVDFRSGTYFDGKRTQLILSPTWNVSRHLELGAEYQLTRLRFPVRDERADIQLLRFRIRTALDARMSANAFVQYNSTTQRADLNLRLRYQVSEGTDLWLVYNEGLDTERVEQEPLTLGRALIVKYSRTFTF
ncbi:MAG TPA: DUF5916 domain-containing protein [Thermoanaerobaculia bacterium]|nr:DUF5916 domain-containing protein [Thermoanaerobaculia bacterium]